MKWDGSATFGTIVVNFVIFDSFQEAVVPLLCGIILILSALAILCLLSQLKQDQF